MVRESGNRDMDSTATNGQESATNNIVAKTDDNAYHRASFGLNNRLARLLWQFVYLLLYRPSPRPFHAWRSALLWLFGAKLGPGIHFYRSGRIWAPWNLVCEDCCALADGAEIYNPALVYCASSGSLDSFS
jgi:putative colanic acid biosynthesis acetyltransferase WcaF